MRYETIGSFLPPVTLLSAKEALASGKMSEADYKAVEDATVREIVDRQLAAGLDTVTSGDVRRKYWDKDFYLGLEGMSVEHVDSGRVYQELESFTDLLRLTGRVAYNPEHPFFDDFSFLKDYVAGRAKCRQTIPSPADLYMEILAMTDGKPEGVYADKSVLARDIAEAYNKTILHFYELGCRDIQLDDTACAGLGDYTVEQRMMLGGTDPSEMKDELARIINDSVAGLPADMEVAIYVSAGDKIVPDWSAEFVHTNPAREILPQLQVSKFFIPFKAGDEEELCVLRSLPEGKRVTLGLISAHSPFDEPSSKVLATVKAAEKFIPADRIAISPSSGFKLTNFISKGLVFEDQWRKIATLAHLASLN